MDPPAPDHPASPAAGATGSDAPGEALAARRRARTLRLGARAALVFEDRRSPGQQVRPRLGTEGSAGAGGMLRDFAAADALLAASVQLEARLHLDQAPDVGDPAAFAGLEERVYAEIEGLGRVFARVLALPGGDAGGSGLLCFALSPDQVTAIRLGADFGFGVDDPRMCVGATVKRELRAALLAAWDEAHRDRSGPGPADLA